MEKQKIDFNALFKVNASGAPFVLRLLTPLRKTIPDWEDPNKIATHKIAYAEDDGGTILYPHIQERDGELIDYSNPVNQTSDGEWTALVKAKKTGDFVRMTPNEAEWFSKNYKKFYPIFAGGGSIPKNLVGGISYTSFLRDRQEAPIPNFDGMVSQRNQPIRISPEEYSQYMGIVIPEEPEVEITEEQPLNRRVKKAKKIIRKEEKKTKDKPAGAFLQANLDEINASAGGAHVFKTPNINVGNLDAFLQEAAKYGIYMRVTRGLEENAKTSGGKTSFHALGDAIDITPLPGQTFEDLKQSFYNNPGLIQWMRDRGFGILEETSEDIMRKTGASGKHWHIGKDEIAIEGLNKLFNNG